MLFVFFICIGFKVNKVVGPSAEGLFHITSCTTVPDPVVHFKKRNIRFGILDYFSYLCAIIN